MVADFDIALFLKNLPSLPGVYRMLDADGMVLYVGKAVNLKRRVSGYFQKNDHSPRIALMVKQVRSVEITVTRSEAEALILENNFIKALSPKYNILFRDDKSYPYLMLSGHEFPQMAHYRGTLKKPNRYFGPYPNGYAVRDSIRILQKVFRLRTCEDSVFAHRDRACLLYQIKHCSGPCVGHISAEDYRSSVREAEAFLNGRTDELTQMLYGKMQTASDALQFEEAARYRDQIQALGLVQSKQFVDSRNPNNPKDIDVLALAAEQGTVCIHWVSIRGGRYVGDKSFFPDVRHDPEPEGQDYAEAFVAQHYLGKAKPDVLITNFTVPPVVQTALNEERGRRIAFADKTRGERKVWLDMAEKNARLAITQHRMRHGSRANRIAELASLLDMEADGLQRLECFDISHTQGEAAVASCVVYDEQNIQPDQYRRYNIAAAKAGDDYAAMREVLTRRYSKMVEAEANGETVKWPDAVLIDGGRGQVGVAVEVWKELGLQIPIIGIAKGPERKAGLEELILPFTDKAFRLPPNSPALHLLQTVRDEAHRFAISGHRRKRDKIRLTSSLNDIPGIGSKRRQALLARFGGLRGISVASVDDLAQTEGISRTLAEKIYNHLH
ncbi:MAG: excinuclease ABC subunit UvrC [Neisseria sp.]|nr:excinuclease ABC subunit UvrC [Neisseria sp.]